MSSSVVRRFQSPSIHLSSLPGVAWWLRKWRLVAFANLAVRQEAKVLLLTELAESIRQGVPLDEALAMIALTEQERRGVDAASAPGADTRDGVAEFFLGLVLFMQVVLGWILYVIASARTADVERVARVMALCVLSNLRKGLPLDVSLRNVAGFEAWEVAAIRAGERAGALPEALHRIADAQRSRLLSPDLGSWAPIMMVVSVLSAQALFIGWKILPRFRDIFAQMGAELPPLTQFLIERSLSWTTGICCVAGLIGWFGVSRALMNGRRFVRWLAAVVFTITPALAAISFIGGTRGAGPFVAVGALLIISPAIAPFLLWLWEASVHSAERAASGLARLVPGMAHAVRQERDAHWIASLACGIATGLPEGEAIRNAGGGSGAGRFERSHSAAERADAGVPIGQAIAEGRLLTPVNAGRVALASTTPHFAAALGEISRDCMDRSRASRRRAERGLAVLITSLCGIAVAVMALGIYLPLFNIPSLVGH